MENPPPLFVFSEKRGKLDWKQVEEADLDQIVKSVDIGRMEHLLQILTFAKLEKTDIKMIKDKNLLKLFKLGQLTTEYLLYCHRYVEGYASGFEREYRATYQEAVALEQTVLDN